MAPEAAPLAELRALALAYRGRTALDGVDLDLRAGQITALLGPNGAGKTSLMRLAAGRLAPERGSVRVAGGDPHANRATRRLIGWVPQEIALYPRLTVIENLDVFAQLAGLGRRERRAALPLVLERTATGDVAGRIVGTLSGGYRRRVNIAASLVTDPRLILLDEPTQGVDLEAREAIHAVLARLRSAGAAILIATHDFAEAERLADRIAILREGRLLREGARAALLGPYAEAPPEHEALLDAVPGPAADSALRRRGFLPRDDGLTWRAAHGVADDLDGSRLLAALRAEGVALAELRLRRPGLEALYRDTLAPARPAATRPARELAEAAG